MSDWARKKAQVMMSFFSNNEDGITAALRQARADALEEAASYCEMKAKHYWGDGRDCCDAALQQTAAAIRALKD